MRPGCRHGEISQNLPKIATFYDEIPADSKSVAYRFHYREAARTLKTEEIDIAHQKVLEVLTKGLGVKFR